MPPNGLFINDGAIVKKPMGQEWRLCTLPRSQIPENWLVIETERSLYAFFVLCEVGIKIVKGIATEQYVEPVNVKELKTYPE